MKKYLLFSATLLLLAACGDSTSTTEKAPETNATQEANTAKEANVEEPKTEQPTTGTELSDVEEFLHSMTSWTSYQSITTATEVYDNGDYPDSEMNTEKQYVVDPAQVYMFTSSIGFSNSHLEQYATEEMSGGFESMDSGEFYDMEPESTTIILKNSLPSRAELLQIVLNNTTSVSEANGTYDLTLDSALLSDIFQFMQTSLFYNATPDELDASILDVLAMDATYHSGAAKIVINGDNIASYEITFKLTSDLNGPSTYTLIEEFDRINDIEEVESPEELMMGIGVN